MLAPSIIESWVTAARPPRRSKSIRAAVYESGSKSRRTLGWDAPTASPNANLGPLATLRDRSRAAVRNDGYAKGSIEHLVTNIIGTGIQPLSRAEDEDFRKSAHKLFLRWTDESDADGRLDWYGQQALGTSAWLEGGECFVRLRPRLPEDGLTVPLQVQLLEPELCPYNHNTVTPAGNVVRAGIEFDRIGRRVAYWFYPSRPEDFRTGFAAGQLRRVPASSVIHLYLQQRPGQLRGTPHLTQALIRLNELNLFDDATLLRQQLANMFVAFLTKPSTLGEGEALNPLTGLPVETHKDEEVLALKPGRFQELAPGEDVEFSEPPDAGSGYADFTRQQLFHISAATGVPYEVLTGDMSKINDRTVRVILHEFRRRVQMYQHQVVAYQLCRPVWKAWMDAAFLSGALEIPLEYLADPEPWQAVKWMPQGWPYLHPVQDVQAQKEAIRSGLTSRSAVVSELGEDAEEIDREQAADNERADELGLRYDSDARADAEASGETDPAGAGEGGDDADDDEVDRIGLLAQKLYLPVSSTKPLLTADEARELMNRLGAGLDGPAPAPSSPASPGEPGDAQAEPEGQPEGAIA